MIVRSRKHLGYSDPPGIGNSYQPSKSSHGYLMLMLGYAGEKNPLGYKELAYGFKLFVFVSIAPMGAT